MSSSTLPYCLKAYRATTHSGADTILLREVYLGFEELAESTDDNMAARFSFELISRIDPPDAYRVRAAILSRGFE